MYKCNKYLFRSIQSLRFKSDYGKWDIPNGYDTGIQIYNCITKRNVPLILNAKKISSWYSCGPTVYDSPHIGHGSCYVKLDIIQKILTNYFDIKLITSMGVTDIDDKIIVKSHLANKTHQQIAKQYELEFWKDLIDLNVTMPHIITRVTEHINTIVQFVEGILKKNMAYVGADHSVYFDTHVYGNYGKLQPSQHFEEELDSFVKKSKTDFALWKAHKPGEPYWETKWGNGRPGWHIECSAMASKLFGNTVDFHAGGIDLQFPHHENEEAQSCAFHGNRQWVNYWIHPGHLNIKGDVKMSKSLKNTISISDFLAVHDAATFRMACLLSNYRHHMEYSKDMMRNAKTVLSKLKYFIKECDKYLNNANCTVDIDENLLKHEFENTKRSIDEYLRDDFDTAKTINQILQLTHLANKMLNNNNVCDNADFKPLVIVEIRDYIKNIISKCFGVNLDKEQLDNKNNLVNIVDLLIDFRNSVRNNSLNIKNDCLLKECDDVREILKQYNIKINDVKGQKSAWVYME